jgi:DNA-binding MarR family transcriptional regulator
MDTTQTDTQSTCKKALPLLSDEKLAAWSGFLEAHSVITKALDADLILNFGIPLSAFEALLRVAHSPDGALRMSDLAKQALLSQSRISRLVTEMEQRGLLRRESCPEDTRVVYAKITDAGLELVTRVQEHHLADIEQRFFAGLSGDEIGRLAALWPRVIAAATGLPR